MAEQSKKILMVDDDVRMRELLQRYLTEQGFDIKTVADAKEMDAALAVDSVAATRAYAHRHLPLIFFCSVRPWFKLSYN